MNKIDMAIRAQGDSPLTPKQIRALIVAAKSAYAMGRKVGFIPDGEDFDTWRHGAMKDVIGVDAPSSFRAITQSRFLEMIQYFKRMSCSFSITENLEEIMQMAEAANKSGSECDCMTLDMLLIMARSASDLRQMDEVRRARYAFVGTVRAIAPAFGGEQNAWKYADTLFQRIHRCSYGTANAKQLWAVLYTMRSRARARMSKGV